MSICGFPEIPPIIDSVQGDFWKNKRKHGDDCVFTPISLISTRQKLDFENNPPTTISNSFVMTASWPGKTGMSCSRACKSRQV